MENSRIDAAGLLIAAAAATLVFFAVQMNFGYLSSLAGLTFLLVVLAYDRQGYRSGLQSLAFASVCGACLTLAAGYVLRLVSSPADPKPDHAIFEEWLSIAWLVGTVVFWGIDRARMGSRQQAFSEAPVARGTGQGFIAQSVPVTGYVPPVPAPAYVPPPAPAYVPPPPPPTSEPQPVFREPEPAASAYAPPPPLEPIDLPVPVPPLAAAPVVAAVAPVAPPPVHQIPPGKEATIYVNLMGEAMNMLRAVRAESVGRDFYLIADEMPENETWEFKPGQVVRCKKKNLSSGKALVAFEEAPRG